MTKQLTKKYDLHVQFEIGYDEQPKIWAYQLFMKDDFLNTDTHACLSYTFTEEDTEYSLTKLIEANCGIETIDDLYWDEWFISNESDVISYNALSPKVIEWINSLPEYEMEVID